MHVRTLFLIVAECLLEVLCIALAHTGEDPFGPRSDVDSAGWVPFGVVTAPVPASASSRPAVPWADTVLYETHVRDLTMRHPEVPEALPEEDEEEEDQPGGSVDAVGSDEDDAEDMIEEGDIRGALEVFREWANERAPWISRLFSRRVKVDENLSNEDGSTIVDPEREI